MGIRLCNKVPDHIKDMENYNFLKKVLILIVATCILLIGRVYIILIACVLYICVSLISCYIYCFISIDIVLLFCSVLHYIVFVVCWLIEIWFL
jgi:hypothetical protein